MDEIDYHLDSLETLKYAELQKLAKKFGVRANLKGDKIITSLRELKSDQPNYITSQDEKTTDSEPEADTKAQKGRKGKKAARGRKRQQSAKQSSDEEEVVLKAKSSASKSPAAVRTTLASTPIRSPLPTKNMTPLGVATKLLHNRRPSLIPTSSTKPTTPRSAQKQSTPKSVAKSTPASSKPTHKSVAKTTPKSVSKSTPVSVKSTPKTITKMVTPKSAVRSTPKTTPGKSSANTPQSKKSTPKSGKKSTPQSGKRVRRNTFTRDEPSPGIADLINGMTEDMTPAEQKESLLAQLDKKVQEKRANQPDQASNIPRFKALTKKTDDGKTQGKKTPGKDWNKIHQQNWDKMASIDDYLAKKRKRTESMNQSVKKMKVATEQMKANINSMKKPKTPASIKVSAKVVKPIGKTTKPAARPIKTSLFQSPAPTVFKPKATSVKSANFNFGKMYNKEKSTLAGNKTPGNPARKSPRMSASKAETKPKLFTIGRTTPGVKVAASSSKENFTLTGNNRKSTATTPFKQTANTSINSAKNFDLKQSLSKPVTWKPHTGKLKPFSMGKLYQHETIVKEVKVKSRDDRRAAHVQQRNDRKKDHLAQRRNVQF